jgi:hypothetical protein
VLFALATPLTTTHSAFTLATTDPNSCMSLHVQYLSFHQQQKKQKSK